jgi:hypothetical protein
MQETIDISSVATGLLINLKYENLNVEMSCTFVMLSFTSFYDPNNI